MSNRSLTSARRIKDDNYYTLEEDIASAVFSIRENFAGKLVYCNCETGGRSSFASFFASHFEELRLKELIVTGMGSTKEFHQTAAGESLVEMSGSSGRFEDARPQELLSMSDIVVTNPPFSGLRTYLDSLFRQGKDFLLVVPLHSLTYKSVFPKIVSGQVYSFPFIRSASFISGCGVRRSFGNIVWLTNLGAKPRRPPIELSATYMEGQFSRYANMDVIDVPKSSMIPKDYSGVMAVPSSFLLKLSDEQFELLGHSGDATSLRRMGARPIGNRGVRLLRGQGMTGHYTPNMVNPHIIENEFIRFPFSRIFIRKK